MFTFSKSFAISGAIVFALTLYVIYMSKIESNLIRSSITAAQSADITKCKPFDDLLFNRKVISAIHRKEIGKSEKVNVRSYLDETPKIPFADTLKTIADQNIFTKAIYSAGIVSPRERVIDLRIEVDSSCAPQRLLLLVDRRVEELPLGGKMDPAVIADFVLRNTSEYYLLYSEIMTRPNIVRGRAISNVENGTDVEYYANLVGISFMVEATKLTRSALQDEKHARALHWFDVALEINSAFLPAHVNKTRLMVKLARHRPEAFTRAVGEMLRLYYRDPKAGYLTAASQLLIELISATERSGRITSTRRYLEQALSLTRSEISRHGGSRDAFEKLAFIYARLHMIEQNFGNEEKAQDYFNELRNADEVINAYKSETSLPLNPPSAAGAS